MTHLYREARRRRSYVIGKAAECDEARPERQAPASPMSAAVKVVDTDTRALIDEAVAARKVRRP